MNQEREDEQKAAGRQAAIEHWCALPKSQADYWEHQATWYKSLLFDAWKALRGQSKGLQRQRRIINRLRAEIAELKRQGTGNGEN